MLNEEKDKDEMTFNFVLEYFEGGDRHTGIPEVYDVGEVKITLKAKKEWIDSDFPNEFHNGVKELLKKISEGEVFTEQEWKIREEEEEKRKKRWEMEEKLIDNWKFFNPDNLPICPKCKKNKLKMNYNEVIESEYLYCTECGYKEKL